MKLNKTTGLILEIHPPTEFKSNPDQTHQSVL